MEDFILQFSDGNNVSSAGDSSSPDYNPIYLILDSTDTDPSPSESVELEASLPSGYYCEGAEVYFRGTTSNYWEVTKDDPSLEPVWSSTTTLDINGNDSAIFYVRASTTFEEVPVQDRSVSLRISGDIREA